MTNRPAPTGPSFVEAIEPLCAITARHLGWRPGDFWTATPRELALAIRDPDAVATPAAPSRELIAEMMERDL